MPVPTLRYALRYIFSIASFVTAICMATGCSQTEREAPERQAPAAAAPSAPDECAHPSRQVTWSPMELDQAIGQLEDILDTLSQQQPMNFTSANIAFMYEARLYILFDEYTASLPPSGCRAAIEEQSKWLRDRQAAIDAAQKEYEGGTLAPLNAAIERIRRTRTRIAELEKKLGRTWTPQPREWLRN